jgi:phospholipase/carboxylesterase
MPPSTPIDRRRFLGATAVAGLAAVAPSLVADRHTLAQRDQGRLSVRPARPTKTIAPGEHVLADDNGRRSVLYVPPTYDPAKPAPFLLALHGATGSGDSMLRPTRAAAEQHGAIVLAPSSADGTWDAIRGTFAVDLPRLDKLLADAFDRCAIDPARLGVVGFSDGATYAISIGAINGDVFSHVIGHSPGFIIPGTPHGRPKFFVSHGRQDAILPIDRCGRRVVAQLRRQGYEVRFDEFDGGHVATPAMRETAIAWMTPQ